MRAIVPASLILLWLTGCTHTPTVPPPVCRITEGNRFGRPSEITVWSDGRYVWNYFENHSFTGRLEQRFVTPLFDVCDEFPMRDGFRTYEIQPGATYQIPPSVELVRGLIEEHLVMP
jgi:hypothetical protein